jgi:cutinase
VQNTVASCPKTKVVIGGYSQGAGVADLTSHQLSPQAANHVAAVALFGNPQSSYAKGLADNQIPAINPSYSPKTIDICLPNDNICAEGGSIIAHLGYVPDATNQAATFVAGKL